ncbi:MAG: toxin-antitoxin system YwqK family antitoxin [Bacteroidales bacterium]|nr:toxin-antitoxin system YwqK family antitoxin [Bacteroidales bacterium]
MLCLVMNILISNIKLKVIVCLVVFLVDISFLSAQKNDLINVVDSNMLKQGKWIYYYDTLHTLKYSEGMYVDGKKQGIWVEYYRNKNVKSEITYVNNIPSGFACLYYDNGNPSEQGTWNSYGWVGEYKLFYRNGKVARILNYDENTLRTGVQKYYSQSGKLTMSGYWENGRAEGFVREYYDNGTLRSESHWAYGKINGVVKEYYEGGSLKAELVYNNGIYDAVSSRQYPNYSVSENAIVSNNNKQHDKSEFGKKPSKQNDKESPIEAEHFTGTGYRKLYNIDDKRLEREGYFINGVFDSGKRYYYNSKGELIKTAIYEHGKIVKIIDK